MKRPPRSAFPERRYYPTGDPVNQSDRTSNARTRPVRVTVDLDPVDYDTLRDFAHGSRMTHTDVLRSLVRLLDTDPVKKRVLSRRQMAREAAR